jgi:hypothetical protein
MARWKMSSGPGHFQGENPDYFGAIRLSPVPNMIHVAAIIVVVLKH